jgi:hypothetical protein
MLHATVVGRVRDSCLARFLLKAADHGLAKRVLIPAQFGGQNRDRVVQGINAFPFTGNAVNRFHGRLSLRFICFRPSITPAFSVGGP